MYQYNKRSKKSPKKILFVVPVILIVLAAGGFFTYKHFRKAKPASTITGLPEQSPESKAADAKAGENQKEAIVSENKDGTIVPATNGEQSPTGSRKTVTPIITSANTTGVSGFVSNTNESDGTCSVTITKTGSKTITKGPTAATPSGQKTDCQTFTLTSSEFDAAGEWKVTLTYSSSTSQGTASGSIMVAP